MKKKCKDCKKTKLIKEFYKHSRMADGYLNKCKDCKRGHTKDYRKNNHEKVLAYDRQRSLQPERKAAINAARKNYIEKNIDAVRNTKREWAERNKEKRKAQNAVCNAVRDGKITKPECCEVCGKRKKLQGHHEDYSRPLSVIWLCAVCHGFRHRELNACGPVS